MSKKEIGFEGYAYAPLGHNQIRLLQVSDKDGISIYGLHHVSLENPPEFSALSYTWDGQLRDRNLICDDSSILKVTQNVEIALSYLNAHAKLYYIWIDGVCINQDDDREKEAQIPLMGRIYSTAPKVIVWLGESSPKIDEALGAFTALPLTLAEVDSTSPIWDGLSELFGRSWFSRIWVVQETVLAQDVNFVCGHNVVEYEDFMRLARALLSTRLVSLLSSNYGVNSEISVRLLDTMAHMREGRAQRIDRSVNFLVLVDGSRWRQCADPRDRLYGLLGLADAEVKQNVPIRYDTTTADVYLNYAKWEVQRYAGPLVLLMASSKAFMEGLPSWCPNFDGASKTISLGLVASTAKYRAGFGVGKAYTESCITSMPDSNIIKTPGFLVDKITNIVPSKWHDYNGGDGHQAKFAALRSLAWEACCLKLSQITYAQPGNVVPEAHWRTLIANKIIDEDFDTDQENTYTLAKRRLLNLNLMHGHSGPSVRGSTGSVHSEESKVNDYLTSVNSATRGRSFACTADGRIGLVPDHSQVGDLICVIRRVVTPLILRPRPYHKNIYELIGEAYIHGIMYGEALDICSDEEAREFMID
jgi:Heterokaryon incompatibility protein (HET)